MPGPRITRQTEIRNTRKKRKTAAKQPKIKVLGCNLQLCDSSQDNCLPFLISSKREEGKWKGCSMKSEAISKSREQRFRG